MAELQARAKTVTTRLITERALFGNPGSVRRPIAFLIVAIIVAYLVAPSFLTLSNLNALLISSSFLVVLAVGEAFVIMQGMIDLGVESVLSASGMLAAWLYVFHRMPAGLAMLITLLVGIAIGVTVGLLVTRAHIPSFIVTLGTFWGFAGIALLYNAGNYIAPDAVSPARELTFLGIASSSFGGHLSNLIIVSVLVVVIAQLVLSYTPFGTWIKSVGSSEAAARAVGLNTALIKMSAFMVSGLLAALAGIMIAAWQDSIYPSSGQGYSLQAIAGVILGGIPFTGGRGTVVGAAIGALIIGVISNLIVLLGLPVLYDYIFVAVILVIAGLQARGGPFVK
jgi:ribose/xylose/arabinose/galactoside ABC-type transport system permease subunit